MTEKVYYHPDEIGWQKVGINTWEKPDGYRVDFPPDKVPRVVKLEDGSYQSYAEYKNPPTE